MSGAKLFGLVFAVCLIATGCGGNEEATPQQGTTQGETAGGETNETGGSISLDGEQANDHGTKDVSGEESVEFEMDDFYFEPTILQGDPGQMVTLEAFNEGGAPHTFTIEGQNVDEEFQPDDEREIEVTFPDSGMLVFVCRFHEQQGMRGALQAS